INWGDGSIQTIGPGLTGSDVPIGHAYTTVGLYNVSVTATDKDGGVSALTSTPITISGAQVVTDPTDATKTALMVGGTSNNDTIQISQVKTPKGPSGFQVKLNGTNLGNFFPSGHIIVMGEGRDDTIAVNSNVTRPCILYGNDGNDTITGGGGLNILVGGNGADTLTGNNSRDILIGGTGADILQASKGEDVLIAGSTSFDGYSSANLLALSKVMDEWSRNDLGYQNRIDHLTGATL